jgi:hypothetical protein
VLFVRAEITAGFFISESVKLTIWFPKLYVVVDGFVILSALNNVYWDDVSFIFTVNEPLA